MHRSAVVVWLELNAPHGLNAPWIVLDPIPVLSWEYLNQYAAVCAQFCIENGPHNPSVAHNLPVVPQSLSGPTPPPSHSSGSIKLAYTPQPTPKMITALERTTVTNIACGHNHTIVSDEAGLCWTWGTSCLGACSCFILYGEPAIMSLLYFPSLCVLLHQRITIPSCVGRVWWVWAIGAQGAKG